MIIPLSRIWSHGSVGRAHRSHRWGHRFESCCDHHRKSFPIMGSFFCAARCQASLLWSHRCASAHRRGAEGTSSRLTRRPVDCLAKAESNRTRGEGSSTLFIGEPDRAQRDHRFESCCDHTNGSAIPCGWPICLLYFSLRRNSGGRSFLQHVTFPPASVPEKERPALAGGESSLHAYSSGRENTPG